MCRVVVHWFAAASGWCGPAPPCQSCARVLAGRSSLVPACLLLLTTYLQLLLLLVSQALCHACPPPFAPLWLACVRAGVSFFSALAEGANFKGANMAVADLESGNFEDANFEGAVLEGAFVNNAQLKVRPWSGG